MKIQEVDKNRYLVTSEPYQNRVSQDWFDANALKEQGAIIGHSTGRNTTWFFKQQEQAFVLRKYFRGGILSKWVDDSYVYLGLKRTRGYRELTLLETMRKLQLPVPEPVALLVDKNGASYRASIIIGLIDNSQDLYHYLLKQPLSHDEWRAVGQLIRRFHQHGIYHADLNIHNILRDQDGVFWLIDFDKGRQLAPESPKLETNLGRLLRSLQKERSKHPDFHWQEADWQALINGYHGTRYQL